MQVDKGLVRELAELLKETDLTEIEVADGERRIRVARQTATTTVAVPAPVHGSVPHPSPVLADAPALPVADADLSKHPGAVPSPMVGTVYLSPEPGKPAFISEGATVKEGQTLLIIEAMKVMNPITSPRGGTVKKILVNNEQPVEFGEPLVIIE